MQGVGQSFYIFFPQVQLGGFLSERAQSQEDEAVRGASGVQKHLVQKQHERRVDDDFSSTSTVPDLGLYG